MSLPEIKQAYLRSLEAKKSQEYQMKKAKKDISEGFISFFKKLFKRKGRK